MFSKKKKKSKKKLEAYKIYFVTHYQNYEILFSQNTQNTVLR